MVAQSTSTPLRQGLNVISMTWQSLIQRILIGPSFTTCEVPAQNGVRNT